MATGMGFAQAGFLVLLCLSFCSARRVLIDSTDVEKPNSPSSLPATQSTSTALKSSDDISSLGDSKWQSACKGNRCSGGGGGGGGGSNCGGNEGCGGCGNFGGCGSGGYYGGCCNYGYGDGCSGGNGGGCDYGCPTAPTCYPVVSCPPVSTCCPVDCPPGYGHPKVAAEQHLSNLQSPASPKVDEQAHHIPDSTPKPDDSGKEKQLEQKTLVDGKNKPGSDGQVLEDVSKNESMN